MTDRTIPRPARDGDAAALGAILSGFIDTTPWMPRLHTPDQDRGFVAALIAAGQVRLVETASAAMGFAARQGDLVAALYMQSDARGQGFGTKLLMDQMEQVARLRLWTFQANTGARAFYRRHGSTETSRTQGDNAQGLPDIELQCKRSD